jgi:hypothetical protein
VLDPKEIIDALILSGALEISAMDSETGDMIFAITDKMEHVAPELYREINSSIYKDIMSLWEKGLLVMNVMSANPMVSPSELALDRANWIDLTVSEYHTMNTVMLAFEGGI